MSNKHGSSWITKHRRLSIYLRDDFRCMYCGRDLVGTELGTITLDHLKPRSEGVDNSSSNLVTACVDCNSARMSAPVKTFAAPPMYRKILRNRRRSLRTYQHAADILFRGGTRTWPETLAAFKRN